MGSSFSIGKAATSSSATANDDTMAAVNATAADSCSAVDSATMADTTANETNLVATTAASANMASSSRFWRYDVFLSFRGDDTRNNFTSYLYRALTDKGINTFKDDKKLEKGEEVSPALLKAIEESRFCIVVLSKDYASSTWCLEELRKIAERISDKKTDTILPIFYEVDPSDVRNQTGSFGEAFSKHEKNFCKDMEKLQNWRSALVKAANISGWDSRNRDEAILIDEIVIYILKKLSRSFPSRAKGLVGIDSRVREMESKLRMGSNDVCMVGIWGMGGIGKSTIAKAIYDRIYGEFESCCFLQSVREVAGKPGLGLSHLQEQLLSKLLKEGIQTIRTLGDNFDAIKDRFRYMRVLIVLDDVDHLKQLRALAGDHNWFGPGSRIIITTRDKHLLVAHGVDEIYEAKVLNDNESLWLFTQYALKNCYSAAEFIKFLELSHCVVKYAKNVPLALQVLGSHLTDKNELEWQDELCQLEISPPREIQDLLRISFDGLDNGFQKNIFLDIACFFKGEDTNYVIKVLEGCGFFPYANLRVLIDKSLISILDNKLWMHDLVQQMGREIVRQASETEPGRRTRLWDQSDVCTVLANNAVTENIEGIILDLSKIKNLHINTEVFWRMDKLRLLKICHVDHSGGFEYLIHKRPFPSINFSEGTDALPKDYSVNIFGNVVALSNDLRCLCWHGYPFKNLPSYFYPHNLVELNMSYSSITKFWTKKKDFDKLKFIKLSHSQNLTMTPNFTGIPNLEILILEGCTNLIEVHPSLGSLKSLMLLNLKDCSSLQYFPREISTTSLEVLILSGCSKLETFPEIYGNMECLSELHLDNTAIQALPPSIERLKGLVLLSARNCKRLQHLPSSFCGLKNLKTIYFSGCSHLDQLLEKLELLENLEELYVDGTTIAQPPLSICSLTNLKVLSFSGCEGFPFINTGGLLLEELTRKDFALYFYLSLSYLTSLDLSYCNLLEVSIPEEFGMLYSLKKLNLSGNKFFTLPSKILARLENLEVICLAGCSNLISLPSLPSNVYCIEAPNCPELVRVIPPRLKGLCMSGFNFMNCFNLGCIDQGPLEDSAATLAVRLLRHHIHEVPSHSFAEFTIIVPGIGIPAWSGFESLSSSVTINLPGHWFNNTLRGLALWAVLEIDDSLAFSNNDPTTQMQCCLEFYLIHKKCKLISDTGFAINRGTKVESAHVWLRYIPSCTFKTTRVMGSWSRLKAVLATHGQGLRVKKCGLYPMCWDGKILA